MKKLLLLLLLSTGLSAFAQDHPKTNSSSQFLLIVRFKSDFVPPSADAVQKNIKHWQEYMGGLAQSGKIVSGYRPENNGMTISGPEQVIQTKPYLANNESVSSVLLIKAVNLDEAKTIAQKCPVFEFGGSVEIRPVTETAR